jgi:DNA helicase-2/ATP-dependent DNA helicase PcrA
VIAHRGQHALVSAVAGSGKTTVLVERNLALVRDGHAPSTLLNLVFNKSAADSFQRRLNERMGERGSTVRTFHGLGLNMLQRLVQEGLTPRFTVDGDGGELGALAKQALKSAWNPRQLTEMYSCADEFPVFISHVKAGLRDADVVWASLKYSAVTRPFVKAFEIYEEQRTRRRLVGFDDMLLDTANVLREHPEAWGLFNQYAREVMADEAQDLNAVQLHLLRGVVGPNAWVMAVGDDDQNIYGWRGAQKKTLISGLPEMFAPMRTMVLGWNFRYGAKTALAANAVIRNNPQRIAKMTVSAPGNPNTALTVLPQRDLGPLVARIKQMDEADRLDDVCLLVREFNHAVRFELALAAAKIPYYVLGRASLTAVQEVAAFVALLSLWVGKWALRSEALQEQCLDGLLRTPTAFLTTEQHRLWLKHVSGSQDASGFLEGTEKVLTLLDKSPSNAEAVRRITQRRDALEAVWRLPTTSKPVVAIGLYAGITNLPEVVRRSAANDARAEAVLGNVQAVREAAERSGSVQAVLEGFAVAMPVSTNAESSQPRVLITSCHRAKGLEWPVVILGSLGPAEPGDQGEEDRRLAYVGITRAQEELIVLSDDPAHRNGPCDPRLAHGSFLSEAMLPDAIGVGEALYAKKPSTVTVGDPSLFEEYLARVPNSGVTVRRGNASAVVKGKRAEETTRHPEKSPLSMVMTHEFLSKEDAVRVTGGRLCACGRFHAGPHETCMCGKPFPSSIGD